jgi:hypothetical protein
MYGFNYEETWPKLSPSSDQACIEPYSYAVEQKFSIQELASPLRDLYNASYCVAEVNAELALYQSLLCGRIR